MIFKTVIAKNGIGGFIVLLENNMYALVSSKKGHFSTGIIVHKYLEAHLKWCSFELCSIEELSTIEIEAIKYNLENCTQFWIS